MKYTTQMDAAQKGIVTKEMETVARKENMPIEELVKKMAEGKIIIPANKNHKSLDAEGIGEGLRTKININLGVSRDCYDIEVELEKVREAIAMEAEAIMDLCSFGKTQEFRRRLIDISTAMVGTVPIYDAVGFHEKELKDITADQFLEVIEQHAQDGVDFITIHSGLNRQTAS